MTSCDTKALTSSECSRSFATVKKDETCEHNKIIIGAEERASCQRSYWTDEPKRVRD